ncbi:MAG: hypothetical protein ACE5HW_04135 [Candidatus Methanofastidiosia archaeon]
MNWKSHLKADPIEWLLEEENPSVRYFTLRDLLDRRENDLELIEAKNSIMESKPVKKIFSHQSKEGFWRERKNVCWGYESTWFQLYFFSILGLDENLARGHGKYERVKKSCEIIFSWFQGRKSGAFCPKGSERNGGQESVAWACHTGSTLIFLIDYGYIEDLRTKKAIEWLISDQRKDGLHKCRNFQPNPKTATQNCYISPIKPLNAFSKIPEDERTHEMNEYIKRAVEKIFEMEIYKYKLNKKGERVEKPSWLRFGFPAFMDLLEVLQVLIQLGLRGRKEIRRALDLVLSKSGENGKWKLERKPKEKMLADVGEKGKENKWITLRALRVIKGFYGD